MLHFGSVGQQHHTVRGSMKHLLKHVWTSRVQIGDRNARIYRENHFRNPVTPPKRQRDKPSPTTTFAILDTLQRNSKLPPSGARSGIFHKHSQAWGPHPLIPKAFLPTEVKGCSPPINSMASCSFSHVIYLYNLSIYIYISIWRFEFPTFDVVLGQGLIAILVECSEIIWATALMQHMREGTNVKVVPFTSFTLFEKKNNIFWWPRFPTLSA